MAYRSGFERTLVSSLKRRKARFKYEGLELPYVMNHTYKPDFQLANGIIIEAKGRFRSAAEIAKMRAVKTQHPNLDIRFVFMYPHKTILNQKTTYAQWAERHGFPWAEGDIPQEWIDEK